MQNCETTDLPGLCGVQIRTTADHAPALSTLQILGLFNLSDLEPHVDRELTAVSDGFTLGLHLKPHIANGWAPESNTLALNQALQLDTWLRPDDLTREVVVAMLMAPVAHEFPSVQEFESAVRIRCNVVQAARKTSLAFHTSEAERPLDCWIYDDHEGFLLRSGSSLVTALKKATQPEYSGALYSFSCYRASEYVILLGIAQELQHRNPDLYLQLETLWTQRTIKSGQFHDVFLREQGSMEVPLPPYFFVPGDRTWFRNPDEASADASGFEGSWVIYLGAGQFSNFWKHTEPYTLVDKCLEIYHWRDGLYRDALGDERIDEPKVAQYVARTRRDPMEMARILQLMQRYREPRGVYTDAGGCIDTTREFARWVCPGTADLVLPSA
jgi:hypothetical protein